MMKPVIAVPADRLVPGRDYLFGSGLRRAKTAVRLRVAEPADAVHWAGYFLIIDGTHRTYTRLAAGESNVEVRDLGPVRSRRQLEALARAVATEKVGAEAFLALRTYSKDWTAKQLELALAIKKPGPAFFHP